MLSMFKRVASDMPTLSPAAIRDTSLMISMVPLEILVGMERAWKKEVFSGPRPVFCDGTGPGRGLDLVGQQEVADLVQVLVGEDEADVSDDAWQDLLQLCVLVEHATDGLAHHGVLAHEDLGPAPEGQPDLLHLQRSDIVGTHHKALVVLVEKFLDLNEVVGFPC